MKNHLTSFLICSALIVSQLLAGDDHADDVAKKDLALLQGKWEIVATSRGGQDITKESRDEGFGMEFKDDAWLQDVNGYHAWTAADSHIKLDPSTSPKSFEHIVTRKYQGKTITLSYPGIYKIDGDSLTMCLDVDLKTRPSEFKSDGKPGFFLATLKRSGQKSSNQESSTPKAESKN